MDLSRGFRYTALISGAIAILIAIVALLGWVAGWEVLHTLRQGMEQMKPVAAVGTLLSGLGLIALNTRWATRWVGVLLGLLIVVLGGLALSVNSISFTQWIDHLLVGSSGRQASRSALAVGIGLILFGLALERLSAEDRMATLTSQWLALIGGLIGLAAAIGYLFGSTRFARVTGDLPLSLNTGVSFLLLAVGFAASTPRVGVMSILVAQDMGGRTARRLIPVVIVVPIILQWLMRGGLQLQLYSLAYGVSLVVTAMIVIFTTVVLLASQNLSRVDRDRTRAEAERAQLLMVEHRARAEAEQRTRQEVALRRATEAINATFTVDDVVREISRSALEATGADLSFVEQIDRERGELEVVAVTGEGGPGPGFRTAYAGSLAEGVVRRDEPLLVPRLAEARSALLRELAKSCPECAALLVPLRHIAEAIGVLILVRQPEGKGFDLDEIDRARTFASLAALAFRKIYLLETAEEQNRELQEVTESRARLVRGFTHDLKNPLGAAAGYAELLEGGIYGELEERQIEGVGRIRGAIDSALGLIDDLVELARSEAGQLEIQWTIADPIAIMAEVGEEYRAGAEAAGLSLSVRVEGEEARTMTDPRRVRQILGNLLSNAVKYTPPGGEVVVRSGKTEEGPDKSPGRWLCLIVEDDGPGIPEDKQASLFQEFVRFSDAEGGVGLGLAISQRIARLLGGELSVESRVGVGSRFTLWIPEREKN